MSLGNIDKETLKNLGISGLNESEQEILEVILKEMGEDGKSKTLEELWKADYEEIPVDIDTFIEDEQYLGKSTNKGEAIYPFWREELREIFNEENNYMETILTGAIGIGKTEIAVIGLCYILYKLLCLKNPQQHYNLTSGSKIGIAFFNVTIEQSLGVAYTRMQEYLLNSSWFRKHGEIRGRKDKRYKPGKDIEFVIGSGEEHGLGRDIFCLSGDTKVTTEDGIKSLDEMHKEYPYQEEIEEDKFYGALDLETPDNVILSYDEFNKTIEWKSFEGVTKVDVTGKDVYELKLIDNNEIVYTIYATDNHKFLIEEEDEYKYVETKDLEKGMKLISIINVNLLS